MISLEKNAVNFQSSQIMRVSTSQSKNSICLELPPVLCQGPLEVPGTHFGNQYRSIGNTKGTTLPSTWGYSCMCNISMKRI